MFLAIKLTTLFLNLAKIQIFIPKSAYGGGGPPGLGIIPKKKHFFECFPYLLLAIKYVHAFTFLGVAISKGHYCLWEELPPPSPFRPEY